LRSAQIGLQCEAVVKFPRLFEKYPFPILINSAMLKVADVFRGGNNFIRLCILRVAQQSEKHQDKIYSVDEFTRRIFGVIHSNDPVARAITLRTLGSFASIIAEKKNVHHSIILSMDSTDIMEVEAAIFAAEKFSEKSKMFASNVCNKIGTMINGLATPTEMKLKLIPILQHMHHNSESMKKAIALCHSVLNGYPGESFVILTLTTMTKLTVNSLLNMQDHISLLLSYLASDSRSKVKAVCLDDLRLLVARTAYLWKSENLEEIAEFALKVQSLALKVRAVRVLNVVCGNSAVSLLSLTRDTKVVDVCREFCYHPNTTLATQAMQLLTSLAISKCLGDNLTEEAVGAIQTYLLLLVVDPPDESIFNLKLVLKSAVNICKNFPEVSERIVHTLTNILGVAEEPSQLHVCECLAAIGSDCPNALNAVSPQILASLTTTISDSSREILQVQVHLCTLLFQAQHHKAMTGPIHGQVVTEHVHYWLLGLQHVCAAEKCLLRVKVDSSNLTACVSDAVELYMKSQATLKAASSPSNPLDFACGYIQLRMRVLQAHHLLLLSCTAFGAKPPPALSSALADSNGQEGTRWAQVIQQLEKCLTEYKEASSFAFALYRSAFDADSVSLLNINVIQQCCSCMKSVISTIISTIHTGQSNLGERQFLSSNKDESSCSGPPANATIRVMHEISNSMDKLLPDTSSTATISHKLIDMLLWSVTSFVRASPSYPRFFFQTLQNTTVKLAVSPQQSQNQEPVSLRADTNLSLKVEGVVQRGDRPALHRQVKSVIISVSTALVSRNTTVNPNVKTNENTSVHLSQTVEPHNDYFMTSFILPFPVLGIHTAKVDAGVVDENGVTWNTGPSTTITIKSYDDSILRQQQQQQQQQLRARVQAQQASTSQQSHYIKTTTS
ncbi:integrator complex subunit 7, partial [Plakobranchus ocellatus]